MRSMTSILDRFHRDEFGGAYTLSYVMVIPVLMLLVALTVESALMMSAKVGTVYSAYAAARSASVHSTGKSWGEASELAERAALQAMLPFASGSTPASSSSGGPVIDVARVVDAYDDWTDGGSGDEVAAGYLRAKVADVAARMEVNIDSAPSDWDSPIAAVVKYRFPFHVPGLGQMIGERDADGVYVFEIRSRVVLGNDGPQNPEQKLGIGYGSAN